jgi:tetratricopeptide (TPR) repeat protein
MPTLDQKQVDAATTLVTQVKNLPADERALWQLLGADGSGKTTVLRRVAEVLRNEAMIPLTITAPAWDIDSAAIAMIETASQLHEHGLINGDMARIADPQQTWPSKMDLITKTLDRHHETVVLLCDEPARRHHPEAGVPDDSPDLFAQPLADWMVKRTRCRRIVSGWVPPDANPAGQTAVPRPDDGRSLLESKGTWGDLWDHAALLREALADPLPNRSAWEMKLCVGLSALSATDRAAGFSMSEAATASVLLSAVLDAVQGAMLDARQWHSAMAQLALARTHLDASVVHDFTSGLAPMEKSVLEKCFLDWNGDRAALHPLVRQKVLARGPGDPTWRLSKAERRAAHDRLKREYRCNGTTELRDSLESLHHELLGTSPSLAASDPRIHFVEQLDEIGRTLSHVHREHTQAAHLFQLAVEIDPNHAYSHHYLAFNLDWEAKNAEMVETHYQKAIELQPTHPWYWSRWISYLATRGRFHEAKLWWRDALDALCVNEDGSPDWVFMNLHRWVARWLLHWAELDFAEEVLRTIPTRLAEKDPGTQALWNLLDSLRQAERGVSVFPLSITVRDWWSRGPHTDLPDHWDGHRLTAWVPARVEAVEREASIAYLVAAKRPAGEGVPPEYFEVELSSDDVSQTAHAFAWSDLHEGSFIELGYYGEATEPTRIGLHRETSWRDPYLLPLVPPPDRWYRRAVESAWNDNRERN